MGWKVLTCPFGLCLGGVSRMSWCGGGGKRGASTAGITCESSTRLLCPLLLAYVLECSFYLSQDREDQGLQIF